MRKWYIHPKKAKENKKDCRTYDPVKTNNPPNAKHATNVNIFAMNAI